jgi:hypothetical protein
MRISLRIHAVACALIACISYNSKVAAQLPTVSGLSPMLGYPASTVTITGTNFNTTSADNIVFFGATRATVTTASSTALMATVPTGATYQRVSVNNTASALTGYSQYPFLPTYDNSEYVSGIINFAAKVDFAAISNCQYAAIGDIDGDGKPDVVLINAGVDTLSVYRNTGIMGTISYAAAVNFATNGSPIRVVIGDIDGDGKPDISVAHFGSTVSVFRNLSSSGVISLATNVDFATGTQSSGIAIGDIDNDGKTDIAVSNWGSADVSVLRNTGSPGTITFATKVDISAGPNPNCVAVGDLDGDGKLDMVVANIYTATARALRNTSGVGSISFDEGISLTTGDNPTHIIIGDMDGDSKADLVVANKVSSTISTFRNTGSSGTISFATKVDFATGSVPTDVATGDINGDGKLDIATVNGPDNTVSVFRSTGSSGTISFAAKEDFATGLSPTCVAIGDVDGDGKPDIAVSNHDGPSLSIIKNNPLELPPTISSISPAVANPGTTVTVTGTHFNATPANNIVYFGATRATVTVAGSTSLAATVPTGATYKEVSVNNTASAYTGYSQYPFLPTFENSAYIPATVQFAAKTDFTSGFTPKSAAIGDIDGDGKPDMVVANYSANTISVYRNTSSSGSVTSGSFATQVTFATGTGSFPYSVAIGDIDGDGKSDLAVANSGSATVSVFRNSASSGSITSGSFAPRVTFATGSNPTSVAICDIDGDGKPDLGVANQGSNSVSVLRNASSSGSITSGSFFPQVTFSAGLQPYSIAIGDIDGDGKPDMAVANYSSVTVSVFRNTGISDNITPLSFAGQVTFASGGQPRSVAIGDIDGDGKPDLAVANYSAATVSVLRNTGSSGSITGGSFATQVPFAAGTNPTSVAMGDIDGDGKPDLAVANQNSNAVSVLRNASISGSITSGSFAAHVTFVTGSSPQSVAIGDIDGDGKPDLAVANQSSSTVSVIRNNPLRPPPTITSISPTVANTGTTITVTGTNFNNTPGNNIVFFGATQATVTAASTTSLTATVPTGATYKEVSVNNAALATTGYSQYPFLPSYDNSAYIPGIVSFTGKVDFTAGTNPRNVAIGDIDGDGKPDLAVVNFNSNTVSVYRNISSSGSITSGSFAAHVTFGAGTNPISVAIGDIDGDGKPDLAVANNGFSTVSVYRNTSSSGSITSGSFAAQVTFTVGANPRSIAIGDIDGDGKPDMAVANQGSSTVSVLRNTSSSGSIIGGSFAEQVTFATGTSPFSVSIADIDGDGKPDLAVANNGSNTVSVLRNTSSIGSISSSSFATQVIFATTQPLCVTIGDIDGDGKPDMAVGKSASASISVFRNTGSSGSIASGSFAAQVTFATGSNPTSVAIGDIDGDGKPDLAVANQGSNTVSVLRNTSSSGSITSGSFATQATFTAGSLPYSVSIGDFDGDGKPDMVVVNNNANTVSLLRNNPITPPPTITAISPAIANTGTSVTVTGTNFSTTPSNNIVFFGATQGAVTSASTTSLTATVPIGATYKEVSVNNIALATTAYSQYPFLPTYDNSPYIPATVNFAGMVDFTAGSSPRSVAIGDIDGDGKPDMAVVNYMSNTVSVYRNISSSGSISSGSFATQVTFATGTQPVSVAIGDIDGDGKADLAVANNSSNSVSVLRNTSSSGSITSGSFAAQVTFATGTSPFSVAIGDIDGDGKPDLAVTIPIANIVSVFRNTGSSGSITSVSFATQVTFLTGSNPCSVVIGDIDGDGKRDMVVANSSASTISVFRNTGSIGNIAAGSFATQVTFVTGTNPQSVAIGDMDGDGKPDLAVANQGSDNVSVLRNTCSSGSITSGSFAAQVTFSTGSQPVSVAIGDIDGDGKPDMAVANQGSNTVSVLRNTSSSGSITSGSFATQVTFTASSLPYSVSIGDLDGDGKPDMVVVNGSANTVSVLRNNPLIPPPTITAISPALANTGTSVTVTGTNFNATPSNNIVFFGATQAAVTAASTTSLTATVPTGATYKEVSVNNTALATTAYSQYPFLPTYDNSAYLSGAVNFADQEPFTAGTTPSSVAIGDIDGDGKPDLMLANYGSNTVSVYRSTSSSGAITAGSFAAQVTFATGTQPRSVAIGDIDGDGKPDLAVANQGTNTVSVFRNTSSSGSITTGSFASHITFATGIGPQSVAIGDIDGDGKPDLAIANNASNTVSVLRNTSSIGSITSGSFAVQATFATGTTPRSVAIGDIDGDGKPDLAVANGASANVSVLRNTCSSGSITSGSFAAQVTFATGTNPQSVVIGDLDGDGKPDLAVANFNTNNVSVLRNTSSSGSIIIGSFAAHFTFATGTNPQSVVIGDIDGDGKPDLAVANRNSNTVSIIRNTSTGGSISSGSFAPHVTFATGSNPISVAVGDIDGDGKPDMVTANQGSNNVSVIRNNPLSPIEGSAGICVSGTSTLTTNTPGGTWSSSDDVIATVGSSTGIVTGVTTGTATISYTVTGGSATLVVTVIAIPIVGSTGGDITICSAATATLSGTGATSYSWSGGINDGVSFTPAVGVNTYTVTGTTGSCSNTATTTVTVIAIPTVGSTGGDITICDGTTATLSGTGATSYSWSGGINDGVSFTPAIGVNTYTVTGTTGSCSNTATTTVTVIAIPTVGSTGGDVTICDGATATLIGTGATSYSWSGGINDGVSFTPTVGVNTYTVTGTTGSCSNTATTTVTVNAIPTVGSTGGDITICSGATATLSGTGATSYSWSGGITNGVSFTPAFGVNTYTVTGTTGSCSNTATTTVTVIAIPTVGSTGGDVTICDGATATLIGTGATSYSWSGGINDGVSFTPTVGVNTYTVTGTTGSCSNTATTTVTVIAIPTVGSTGGDVAICDGATATLIGTGATSYSWSGGINDGVSFTPTVGVNTYTVTGTTGSCSNTATTTVTVNAIPTVGSTGGDITICSGATATLSGTGATSYSWSGGITNGVSFTPAEVENTYTVTGTTGSCSNTATTTVTVNTLTDAGTITGADEVVAGSAITLTASVSGGAWSASNTNATVSGGVVTGVTAGTSIISYIVSGSCGNDTVTKLVTITTATTPITGELNACAGSTTSLSHGTAGGVWTSSDTAVATVNAGTGLVSGIIAGTATISYTYTGITVSVVVTISASPAAIGGMAGLCPGATTLLTHSSAGGTWSSSNVSVATVSSTGTVSGITSGTAAVTYMISAACYRVKIMNVYSMPTPISGPTSICVGSSNEMTSTLYSSTGVWSSAETTSSVIDETTGYLTGIAAGTNTITYTTSEGCYRTLDVTVNSLPELITGTGGICEGSTTLLSSATSGGTWVSGNVTTATVSSTGLVNGISAGTVGITYTSADGCRRKKTVTVEVMPSVITGALTVCTGNTTTLSSATTGATWSSAATGIATVDAGTGLVSGISPGTADISYSNGSCYRTVVVTVNVATAASTGTTLVCAGQAATLSNATSGGTWSSSNTAAATVHAASGLVTGIGAGTTNITYALSGGCNSVTEITVNAAMGSIAGTTSACIGSSTTLSHSAAGGVWSSSNVTRATIDAGTGLLTGVSGGSATISYVLSAGCVSTVNIMVYGLPNTIGGGSSSFCLGAGTNFSCTPGGGTWSSSNTGVATIGSTGVISSVSAGTSVISYTVSTGCASTRTVTVLASPSAITGSATACIGSTTTLSSSPSGGTWTSSVPSKATVVAGTGVVTGVATGNSTISYTLATGCRRTIVATVVALPGAIGGVLTLCSSCTTTLTSATTGGVWSSANTGVATVNSSTGAVSGVGSGTATISYTAAGGCARRAVVTVSAPPSSITGFGVVCVGQTNATLGNPVSGGTWSSSNTAIATIQAANGLLTGTGVGNANITYTTSPGVYTILVATVNVAVANITGTPAICPGATNALANATSGGVWSSSNAAIATVSAGTGVVTAVTAGTTTISYLINLGCFKTITQTVNSAPNVTGASNVVNGASTTFGGSPGGGTWSSANPAIASISGTGVVTGNSVAATTITYTLGTGCFRTKAISVLTSKPGETEGATLENAGVLKVYPNPTSGQLTIEAPQNGIFSIFTIDGKQVTQYTVTTTAATVSLPKELAAGIYMCRFAGADGSTAIVRLVFEP